MGTTIQGEPTIHNGVTADHARGDFNLRILGSIANYISDHHGKETLAEIATKAGISIEMLDGRSHWGSAKQANAFLVKARELFNTDEEFKTANIYKIKESYGVFGYVLRAVSPLLVYERIVKTISLISRVSHKEIIESGKTHLVVRYHCSRPESRPGCLSRQAFMEAIPTIWDLPAAKLTETSCIAHGDPHCEYHLRWHQHRRWWPVVVGLAIGAATVACLVFAGIASPYLWPALPLIGGLAGLAFELFRTNKANLKISAEMDEAVRELAFDDAEARRELLELNQRQQEWSRRIEQQVTERDAALLKVREDVGHMQSERSSMIRDVSHDLKGPFSALRADNNVLMAKRDRLDPDLRATVEDQTRAIGQLKQMLADLVRTATANTGLIRLSAEQVEVALLVDQLQRRLRALAHGKELRTSVSATGRAPGSIEVDRLLFDRVVDNLLTNAVKYTERGSIDIELDGKPEFLTLKVSDTGRGIHPDHIEQVFLPQGSDPKHREQSSHGIGLSVVVQLLGQIGGELEVQTHPGSGTIFWAHFPVVTRPEAPGDSLANTSPKPTPAELIARVVKIRSLSSGCRPS